MLDLARFEQSPALIAAFVACAVAACLLAYALLRERVGRPRRIAASVVIAGSLLLIALGTLVPVSGGGSAVNLEPLTRITSDVASLKTFIANIAIFVPLGVGLGLAGLRSRWAVAAPAGLSVAIEVAQHYAGLGRISDVDDVIGNAIGGIFGFAAVALVSRARATRRTEEEAALVGCL